MASAALVGPADARYDSEVRGDDMPGAGASAEGRARTGLGRIVAVYLALAVALSWPAVLRLGSAVPGSAHTDLWDSLWSLWFAADSALHGQIPYRTTLLEHPGGGTLVVADPLGALLILPLLPLLGLAASYTLLVLGQLTFAGVAAHRLAEAVLETLAPQSRGAPWVAGVGYASAPVLLSGIHNGNSESFSGGWAALAALCCWRAAVEGGLRRVIWAGISLLLAALGSWYGGVVAFLFAGALLVLPPPQARGGWRARLAALALGLALVAPLAWGFQHAATSRDNLVGIKDARETATVRRTTGPADPLAYVIPGDYRSPDFREISRYGEDFVHCPYLGWALMGAAGLALARRRRGLGALAAAGLGGGLLSLGPVLARKGMALIFLDDRVLPLPYLLVERLPGFSSLSLVWRLAQAPALAVAVLASVALAGRSPRSVALFCAAVLVEVRLLSPVAHLPDLAEVGLSPAIEALRTAPAGAVMNFPVVGGRGYLYEQTHHRHPLAGTLNFPNNGAARRVWQALLDGAAQGGALNLGPVVKQAQKQGIRYIVVHEDPSARPDMHDVAVRALAAALTPMAEGPAPDPPGPGSPTNVRVYRLW